MRPDKKMTKWGYYSSSASSGSRLVHSFTSWRQPSITSLDLHTRLCFFLFWLLQQLLELPVWQPLRVVSSEDRRDNSFLLFLIWFAFFLGKRRPLPLKTLSESLKYLVETGSEVRSTTWEGPSPLPKFPSPCRSAQAQVSPHPSSRKFFDIVGCGCAGSSNVHEHSISRIFFCHLWLACVKIHRVC